MSRFDTVTSKEKDVELMECTQSLRTQFPKWISYEPSWLILILLIYYILTLALLTLDHVICFLSPVKCYISVHVITRCILNSILGWPIIPTEYMLPRTET